MAETYQIYEGGQIILKQSSIRIYQWKRVARLMKQICVILFTLAGSWMATLFIFQNCISPVVQPDGSEVFPLLDRITTGSLFATFGSAIIAVFVLFTNRYLNLFDENISILTRDLASDELSAATWRRWPFLPRTGKLRIRNANLYFYMNNATICFTAMNPAETFSIPTTLSDFKELPILRGFLRLKLHRNTYLTHLKEMSLLAEYPAWDCISAIYQNILFYRLCYSCVWVGACFVFQSILFSFFYPVFFSLLTA